MAAANQEVLKALGDLLYNIARGHTTIDGNPKPGFTIHGNRQLYWKGRSDAAAEIRMALKKMGLFT